MNERQRLEQIEIEAGNRESSPERWAELHGYPMVPALWYCICGHVGRAHGYHVLRPWEPYCYGSFNCKCTGFEAKIVREHHEEEIWEEET